jgi:hypothetical protein
MPVKAGQVVIEMVAGGSAKFISDVAGGKAALRSFGAARLAVALEWQDVCFVGRARAKIRLVRNDE